MRSLVSSPNELAMEEVVLKIPSQYVYQLVFRHDRTEVMAVDTIEGVSFHFCSSLGKYVRYFSQLCHAVGFLSVFKGCLKILSGRRLFYFVTDGTQILHHAWVTLSYSRHYYIDNAAVVIGPIATMSAARGRGLATFATQSAMNALRQLGHRTIYIDTSNTNAPCLKVISNCGFGLPIATYIRGESTAVAKHLSGESLG
jgi:hypothetical protein